MSIQAKITAAAAAVTVAFSIGMVPSVGEAAKAKFNVPEADWTGGQVTCRLIEFILEDHMDYKIKRVGMPSGPAVAEAIRSGDLDYACESWPSYSTTKEKFITKWGGDGTVAYFGEVGVVGQSGYYVPRYVLEGDAARGIKASAPDLKTYEQLNQYAEVFKTLETGDKGRLLACPVAAWQCEDAGRVEGLKLNYHPVELGSETAHWAEMQGAYKRGEPFLAYAWEPHWIHAALDLVEVGLPAHSDDGWPATDWPQDITFNYGSPNLEKEHPAVVQLIKNMNLNNTQQAEMILEIDVNKRKMDEVVREWMTNNEAVWKSWIPSGS